METKKPCSRCRGPRTREDRAYCNPCSAAYEKGRRKSYKDLSPEAKQRQSARAYVNSYIKRGKIPKGTECETCHGTEHLHAHHDDYDKPLEIRWLCRPCHHEHHRLNSEL